MNILRTLKYLSLAPLLIAPNIVWADWAVSGGVFYFHGTDYYYPNFYDAVGFRGEIEYVPAADGPDAARFQLYGYPGDDNIFEGIVEYRYVFRLAPGQWRLGFGPGGGLGITKFQYPVPYFPVVTHQYLGWWRFGYDVTFGRPLGAAFTAGVGDRGRLLFAGAGEIDALAHDRVHWQNGPFLEFAWRRPAPRVFFVRAGAELGGYYDAVFINRENKARLFAEFGVVF